MKNVRPFDFQATCNFPSVICDLKLEELGLNEFSSITNHKLQMEDYKCLA